MNSHMYSLHPVSLDNSEREIQCTGCFGNVTRKRKRSECRSGDKEINDGDELINKRRKCSTSNGGEIPEIANTYRCNSPLKHHHATTFHTCGNLLIADSEDNRVKSYFIGLDGRLVLSGDCPLNLTPLER